MIPLTSTHTTDPRRARAIVFRQGTHGIVDVYTYEGCVYRIELFPSADQNFDNLISAILIGVGISIGVIGSGALYWYFYRPSPAAPGVPGAGGGGAPPAVPPGSAAPGVAPGVGVGVGVGEGVGHPADDSPSDGSGTQTPPSDGSGTPDTTPPPNGESGAPPDGGTIGGDVGGGTVDSGADVSTGVNPIVEWAAMIGVFGSHPTLKIVVFT